MPQRPNQIEIICAWCNKPFTVKKSVADRGRRFCSWDCKMANASTKWETIKCEQCGKEFTTQISRRQRYCSQSCSTTARNLTDWNPSHHRDISGPNNPMYGKPGCKGARNGMYGKRREQVAAWRGGRKVRKDGYILVLAPDDHPIRQRSTDPSVYILEHRFIMEQHLGRYLEDAEIVHHIDGNPTNNDIENLCLYKNQSDHIHLGHSSKK